MALVFAFAAPPAAAFDWLEKGKELFGGSQPTQPEGSLSEQKIAAGIREALEVGSARVVEQLGTVNGFNTDPEVHIPLPDSLKKVRAALGTVGMSGMLDELELKLNRAAETATPKAKELFLQAIKEMTLDDVMSIYNGPSDAATRYFENRMSAPLGEEMRPIIQESLAEVGAVRTYNAAMGEYQNLPFVPDAHADLTSYVVERATDGIFYYLAREEAAIRSNPAKRTTELLQIVFGRE